MAEIPEVPECFLLYEIEQCFVRYYRKLGSRVNSRVKHPGKLLHPVPAQSLHQRRYIHGVCLEIPQWLIRTYGHYPVVLLQSYLNTGKVIGAVQLYIGRIDGSRVEWLIEVNPGRKIAVNILCRRIGRQYHPAGNNGIHLQQTCFGKKSGRKRRTVATIGAFQGIRYTDGVRRRVFHRGGRNNNRHLFLFHGN